MSLSSLPALLVEFAAHPSFYRLIVWWLVLAALGLAFLPLTLRLFRAFHDGGYLFSRLLGLLLTSYAVWLLSSLRLAPFTDGTAYAAVAAAALVNYSVPGATARVRAFLREKRRIVVAEEYLFLLCLLAWAFLRGVRPELDSIEKFMDLGFLNAAMRGEWMPPTDMWFAGKPINYYYFGHFFTAFLCRLTRTPTEIGFNLMVATLFSFAFTLSFSIVHGMLRNAAPRARRNAVVGGLLAALLVAGGGTLHPFIYGALPKALESAGVREARSAPYNYWDATRFIGYRPPGNDRTIHEVPLFTFVLGELHGHSLDIPASLAAAGMGASLVMSAAPAKNIRPPLMEVAAGVLLGATWMTNTWNYPISLTVLAGAALTSSLLRHGRRKRALAEAGLAFGTLLAVSLAACLPYLLHFESFTEGVRRVAASSPLWQLAVLWGYQLFFAACLLIFLLVLHARRRGTGAFRVERADIVALGMFAAALCLVAITETVYVKDLFSAQYPRANTVFKITYQAFILAAAASGYAAARIAGGLVAGPNLRATVVLLFAMVASMPMTYAFWAIPGYYGPLPPPGSFRGLDGLSFLSSGDREIVEWFRDNVAGQPVILEADGDAYTRYGRISAATGLPTPLGWFGHQWLWRGGAEEPKERRGDVRALYESADPHATAELVGKYAVRYIVLGSLERERFPSLKEEKLEAAGGVVLRTADGSKIIETARP